MRANLTGLATVGVAAALALFPRATLAAPYDNHPKLVLHARSVTAKNPCTAGILSDCQNAVTEGDLATPGSGPYYFAYLLVAKGNLPSVAGTEFGIQYDALCPGAAGDLDGVDVFSWFSCLSFEFSAAGPAGPWPNPGSSNLVTWNRTTQCQTGETAVVGYFYLSCYGRDDDLELIPRPVSGLSTVSDCNANQTILDVSSLGHIAFSAGGARPGCNPCDGPCPPPHVLSTSCAPPSTDHVPPAAVGDLEVVASGGTKISLRWTATGDDGQSGTADHYEIRRSSSPITDANFASAMLVPGPGPAPAGTRQGTGVWELELQSSYDFAIKVVDEAGNRSALSNVVHGMTTEPPVSANDGTVLLLNLQPAGTDNPCGAPPLTDCRTAVTGGLLAPATYFACLLVAGFTDLSGVNVGLDYGNHLPGAVNDHDGIDILSWSRCTDTQLLAPTFNWPAPGSGSLLSWDSWARCQVGPSAMLGYFYLTAYSPDVLKLVPSPSTGPGTIVGCSLVETVLPASAFGSARFSASGAPGGTNPCQPTPIPVRSTTWSRIKTLVTPNAAKVEQGRAGQPAPAGSRP